MCTKLLDDFRVFAGHVRSALKVCELNTIQKFDTQIVSNVIVGNNISQSSRLNNWRDVGDNDIKIFLAHLIAVGLVRKGAIEKYWDHGKTVKTPFLGTYMGCNTFQAIHSIYNPNHNKLFKVCPVCRQCR